MLSATLYVLNVLSGDFSHISYRFYVVSYSRLNAYINASFCIHKFVCFVWKLIFRASFSCEYSIIHFYCVYILFRDFLVVSRYNSPIKPQMEAAAECSLLQQWLLLHQHLCITVTDSDIAESMPVLGCFHIIKILTGKISLPLRIRMALYIIGRVPWMSRKSYSAFYFRESDILFHELTKKASGSC